MLVDVDELKGLVSRIFVAEGCSAAEGDRIAHYLAEANLTGHDSHGVVRVPRYVDWLRSGECVADQTVEVVTDSESFAILDAKFGFGPTVGPQAVRFGIDKAERSGVAVIALRNAGHLGRIGAWAEMALGRGQASIHFVNVAGSLLVAPFGGVERRFSTAPISIGFPVPDGDPVVLDFATSAVAEGKVLVAADGGKPVPPGSLIDTDGSLSTDPQVLYGPLSPGSPRDHRNGTGAIRAMGEHKGSGLALICELLGGALTGNGCAGPGARRFANGMLSIYLPTRSFDAGAGIGAETRRYIDFFKSCRPAEPGGEVLLPGEPERARRAERRRDGIPLAEETWAAICATARRAGVAVPEARPAA
jgi:uncharacterized oxidoreductase